VKKSTVKKSTVKKSTVKKSTVKKSVESWKVAFLDGQYRVKSAETIRAANQQDNIPDGQRFSAAAAILSSEFLSS
jgi:hypothetical protein